MSHKEGGEGKPNIIITGLLAAALISAACGGEIQANGSIVTITELNNNKGEYLGKGVNTEGYLKCINERKSTVMLPVPNGMGGFRYSYQITYNTMYDLQSRPSPDANTDIHLTEVSGRSIVPCDQKTVSPLYGVTGKLESVDDQGKLTLNVKYLVKKGN